MELRKLRPDEVTFDLEAEQDLLPVAGNALASGDDEVDSKYNAEILARLAQGDIWAWASVTVTAKWGCFSGEACLGGCTYSGKEEFSQDVYFLQLCDDALADLQRHIQDVSDRLDPLIVEYSNAEIQVL